RVSQAAARVPVLATRRSWRRDPGAATVRRRVQAHRRMTGHRARLAPPAASPYNGGVCKTAAPLLPEQPRSWQAGPGSVPWRPIPHVFRRADTARKPPVTVKTLPATRNWMVPGKPVEGISTRVHPWWAGAWPRLTRSESHMLFEDLGLSPA